MKRLTKFICIMLLVAFLVTGGEVVAMAAPSRTYVLGDTVANNQKVEALAEELEQKYGIIILYPTTGIGYEQLASIFPEMLETLDTALATVTPEVVRQVSSYYYNQTDKRLTFVYTYADLRGPYSLFSNPEVTVGSFDRRNSRIELYIPVHDGQAIATGDNPLTIIHEFAHAMHLMLTDLVGYSRMEREWNNLMDNASYGQKPIDKKTFITEYASISFEEDFAETFAHVYICNRPGLGFAYRLHQDRDTLSPLGEKVAYIESLIKRHITVNEASLENYRGIYTTPASINELGIRLSGLHLVFIGMAEPRTVPLMLLNNLNVIERNTVWLSDIGGWYCQDVFGNHLVLFPDGTYGNPGKNILDAAIELENQKREELERLQQNQQQAQPTKNAA